ncbi:hypothetical protein WR25_23063 [Diploscapter pachys]|uniref:Uncharacterized protein n=1 Tax=Diploscapter pachys TaxID=2018661 RepID=A0A2A2JD27_9BILA|nr:hypothetical protein WR25_23063 [Diploscapter pachys]
MWKNPAPSGNGTASRTVTAWEKIDQRMDRALQDVELTLTHIRNNADMVSLVKHKDKGCARPLMPGVSLPPASVCTSMPLPIRATVSVSVSNEAMFEAINHKRDKERPGIVDQWMAFRDSGGQSNETDDMVIMVILKSQVGVGFYQPTAFFLELQPQLVCRHFLCLSHSQFALTKHFYCSNESCHYKARQQCKLFVKNWPQSKTSVCSLPLGSSTPISSSRICRLRAGTLKANKLRRPVAVNKDSGCIEVVVPENVCTKQPTPFKKESKLHFSSQIAVPNEGNTLLNRLMISGTFTDKYLDNITVNGLTFNAFKPNDSRAGCSQ